MIGGGGNNNQSDELAEVLKWVEKNRVADEKRAKVTQETVNVVEAYQANKRITRELTREIEISPAQMQLVINEKQNKSQDNRQLNCRVFADLEDPKLKEYIEGLAKDDNAKPNSRYQIVFQNCENSQGIHWSAADILVNKDAIQILHFDSVANDTNSDKLADVLYSIDSPKPISLVCSNKEDVQMDANSCSVFALSSALAMSKLPNLHTIAQEKSEPNIDSKNNVTVLSIEASELPANLLKSAQSSKYIKAYEEKHAKDDLAKITKKDGKTESISEYAQRHTQTVPLRNKQGVEVMKPSNLSVLYKRNRYVKIAENSAKTSTASLMARMISSTTVFDALRTNEPDAIIQPRIATVRVTTDGLQVTPKVEATNKDQQVERQTIKMGMGSGK